MRDTPIIRHDAPLGTGSPPALDTSVMHHPATPPLYDPVQMMLTELRRQGVPGSFWRVSSVNMDYGLCKTYPAVLAFPATFTDEHARAAAEFRSQRTCKLSAICSLLVSMCGCKLLCGGLR